MRVVFFLQGQRVPAARARGFAVARALEAQGVEVSLRIPHPSVYGDTDLPRPLRDLRPLFVPAAALARLGQLGDLRPGDVVFFQRFMTELPTVVLERLAARGRRSIFDFDDAIHLNRTGGPKLRALVGLADHVIAGNRTLMAAAAAPRKTTIIPTAVDTDRLRPHPPRLASGRNVVIGWTGLASNYPQLAVARAGIARALQRTGARFLVISNAPPPATLAALHPEYRPWCAETEVEDLARIDVGVMPLPDNPYAQGKCAFKLIQYMALGKPGVASPVGANCEVITDGIDGCLPATDEAWEDALVRLVGEPTLRAQMGARAAARVETAYSLHAVVPSYLDVLRAIGGARS